VGGVWVGGGGGRLPFGRTAALGSTTTQPLTEVSARDISGEAAGV